MSNKNHIRVLLAISALFYAIFIYRTSFEVKGQTFFTLLDDAMISMRYAQHLSQGHGLVWNINQAPVEGFTNLGWTLVMALAHILPFSTPKISLAIMVLAGLILLANSAVTYKIAQALFPSAQFAPLIAATVTAFYFPLVFWTLRGLEVGALTLSVGTSILLAITLQTKPKSASVFRLTLLLCISLLIRMDALIACGLILLYLASKQPRAAIVPAIVTILFFGTLLIFQKLYFGDFLPNTYYLKVNGVTAWERIRVGLLALNAYAMQDFLMPAFIALLGIRLNKEMQTRETLLLLSIFLAQIAYSVWVGGDYAEDIVESANRFITQGMPALFILFALTVDGMNYKTSAAQIKPIYAFIIGMAAVFVVSGRSWNNWAIHNAPMLRSDIQRTQLGIHIKEYTNEDAVIAVHAAGQIPYYSERATIDLLGKSDPIVAKGAPSGSFVPGHNKWNYEYSILMLKPDLIADTASKFRAFIDNVPEYQRLPNGIFVRVDSKSIDMLGLSGEYQNQ